MDGQTDLRSRRTAPKEVRRQQLIEATLDVIAEKGVSGTTMSEVTKRAGLSVGTVNLHFESKDNLLKSSLQFLAQELKETWTQALEMPSLTTSEKIWGIIDANFAPQVFTHTKIRVWFGFFGEARYRDFYRETVETYDNERGQALGELLLRLHADTNPNADFDATGLAQSIESMADGLWLGIMLYPDWMTRDDARSRIWDLLSLHFPKTFVRGAMPRMDGTG